LATTFNSLRNQRFIFAAAANLVLAITASATAQQNIRTPNSIQQLMQINVPVVLCIDDMPAAGARPTSGAYSKAAANGYRSILTLRNDKDGVDRQRERAMVEREGLRYFNISVFANEPRAAQVDQFLSLVRDKSNHPMLINCAFAERVAPLMMIFRIIEQGWSEEKALAEAAGMGMKREPLRIFAHSYLAREKSK
jgi:protein tyrosine phosphatase (PTP) superfamily phosphohydrolase (DUF442 family)